MQIVVPNKDNIRETIKAIGQAIIDKADDVANDVKDVRTITLYSIIESDSATTIDITKSYYVREYEDKKELGG